MSKSISKKMLYVAVCGSRSGSLLFAQICPNTKSEYDNTVNVLKFRTLYFMLFIPHHTIVAGYYGFALDVRMSVRPLVLHPSIRFLFPDDNLSKHQWIFIKLGMCIDIVDIWFGIANGQISSNFFGVICLRHAHIFVSGR